MSKTEQRISWILSFSAYVLVYFLLFVCSKVCETTKSLSEQTERAWRTGMHASTVNFQASIISILFDQVETY